MKPLMEQDHYEILELPRNAVAEDIERAYRVACWTYDGDSLAAYSVFGREDAFAIRERVESAFQVLSDSTRRREYDDSIVNASERDAAPALRVETAAPIPPTDDGLPALGDVDEEHGEFDGARLRRCRLRRGLELKEIAAITRISSTHLRYLEDECFEMLPAPVYVRGFVCAYARCVGLDSQRVAQSFMARFESALSGRKRSWLLGRH